MRGNVTGMELTRRIRELIEPSLEDMGYEVVRVLYRSGENATLQVMAERKDDQPMNVDDCADISRVVSALLDVDDPITDAYNLEVSSPGIDRPLTRLKDFERFKGFEAKIETHGMVDGRKRFRGRLEGVEGEQVNLRLDDGAQASLPFEEIRTAKLVLTDELIAAVESKQR